jgi:hypothetical protein
MSLQTLVNACIAQHVQNVSGVATAVEIRRPWGEVVPLNTTLEVIDKQEADERGGLQTIEMATIFVPLETFDPPLGVGDRLCVDNVEPSYTFFFAGNRAAFGQVVTFQRYVSLAQGARKNRVMSNTGRIGR